MTVSLSALSYISTQEPTFESVFGMSVLLVTQVISYKTDVTNYMCNFPMCISRDIVLRFLRFVGFGAKFQILHIHAYSYTYKSRLFSRPKKSAVVLVASHIMTVNPEMTDESSWIWLTSEQMGFPLRSEFANENHGEARSSKQFNDQRTDQIAFFLVTIITDFI